MATQSLHHALLRPAIIHILRASGFHSTKPSVLDTLTDLCARYLTLLASHTAQCVNHRISSSPSPANHSPGHPASQTGDEELFILSDIDKATPSISDVRLALASASFFASALTASEESWREVLRKPLDALPAAAREKERRRRDAEDTRDVREFIDWATGPTNREIRRIAGLLQDEPIIAGLGAVGPAVGPPVLDELPKEEKEDYLTVLKKKHSKTGDVARYAGTALGKLGEDRGQIRIEGGPPSLAEVRAKRRLVGEEERDARGPSKRQVSMT